MKTEVLIVGAGPAGAAAAMFLLKEGIQPVIVESESFPRYHVGESMNGGAGQMARELGLEEEMLRRQYPLKAGVKVYGGGAGSSWFVPVRARTADGGLVDQETWQVRRSDFDKLLFDTAVERGANLVRGKAIAPVMQDGAVTGARVRLRDGGEEIIESELLLDCSGQATWLANLGGVTGPKYMGAYDKQIAIFSQVRGAVRDQGTARDEFSGNTLIFYGSKYHWAWFIPVDDETVSVGVVAPSAYFLSRNESKRDFLARELQELHPELKRRIPEPDFVEDVHVIPNYSFQVKDFCGKGFMCIGDAHRFVDPIFSFGLSVALREAQFAAKTVRTYLGAQEAERTALLAAHQLFCEKGIDIFEDTLDAFWEKPIAFSFCAHDRYRDLLIDIFAGRVYEHENQPSVAVKDFRRMLGREGERERSYLNNDLYSMPIGSRYHPERAPIWEANSEVRPTADWMIPEKARVASGSRL